MKNDEDFVRDEYGHVLSCGHEHLARELEVMMDGNMAGVMFVSVAFDIPRIAIDD